jgi:hypothetical protein
MEIPPSNLHLLWPIIESPALFHQTIVQQPLSRDFAVLVQGCGRSILAPVSATVDPADLALVRGLMLYALDDLPAAHSIFQEDHRPVSSYFHGMLHRREGDFGNARYWFHEAGPQPFFPRLYEAVVPLSGTVARKSAWDPRDFAGLCEKARLGDLGSEEECRQIARVEWLVSLGHLGCALPPGVL